MQNDAGETHGGYGADAIGLGDEMDEAFRRGREYATSKRSESYVKAACKKRTAEYKKEMLRGWRWQKAREKKG